MIFITSEDTNEAKLNIYQKLAKIRKPVQVIQKDKSGYGYRYVSEELILSKITGLMDKLGVLLMPSIVPDTLKVEPYRYGKTKVTKDGQVYEDKQNEVLVYADMVWSWINLEDPSDKIDVPWTFVGQQADAGQAMGSGLTYASRYFLLKYFNIATPEDDPDAWRRAQKEAAEAEDKEIAKQIIDQVHIAVTDYLAAHADDRPIILDIVKKYAKSKNGKASHNYYEITDPKVAGQLFEEIKTFINKKEQGEK